jgi:hypothetical protein
MTGADLTSPVDFSGMSIAKNASVAWQDSVYFGVPPKAASSVVNFGITGSDIDRFMSATSFQDTSYIGRFGYFGFDRDSLSAGVSGKFARNMTASLYYNGNIVEDVFAYISNNSLTNGKVGLGAQDGISGTDYDFVGDLKDRNNINSRSNINLMFGAGIFGINVGYSQKLFGLVKKSTAEPQRKDLTDDAVIENMQEALLDNALVPNVEFGLRFDTARAVVKTALGFQVDIHQHREMAKGETIELPDYFGGQTGTYTVTAEQTRKLSADYLEPAVTFRIEGEFPADRSRLGIALETAGRLKLYSNMDDKGGKVDGIFWSQDIYNGAYINSVTTSNLDLEVLGRPSVRYATMLSDRFTAGLSGGFGVGLKFGSYTTKNYAWTSKADFMLNDDPYDDAYLSTDVDLPGTVETIPSLDMALYPNLGAGFSFNVVPGTFVLNGGVGAVQTLYRIRTGEVTTETPIGSVTTPLLEQSWGKPLAQLALGAMFRFKQNFTLDALFSSNGTRFDNANFVIQFSAKI